MSQMAITKGNAVRVRVETLKLSLDWDDDDAIEVMKHLRLESNRLCLSGAPTPTEYKLGVLLGKLATEIADEILNRRERADCG